MKLRGYYVKKEPSKIKLKVTCDKKSKSRPAWIQVRGLPDNTSFIVIHLGKKGKEGKRIQYYKIYLPPGLFLPIDYTRKEMQKFYDKLSEIYDKKLKETNYNINAGKYLCNKLKKFTNTNKSILDLGAGTGLITEIYYDAGFKDITLIDYSRKMLNKAKKRKKLKNCRFIFADIKKMDLKRKFDIIISHFAFGSSSYFNKEDLITTLKLVKKYIKSKGLFAIIGHFHQDLFEKEFKKLKSGIYTLDKKREFYTDYFIGRKK